MSITGGITLQKELTTGSTSMTSKPRKVALMSRGTKRPTKPPDSAEVLSSAGKKMRAAQAKDISDPNKKVHRGKLPGIPLGLRSITQIRDSVPSMLSHQLLKAKAGDTEATRLCLEVLGILPFTGKLLLNPPATSEGDVSNGHQQNNEANNDHAAS